MIDKSSAHPGKAGGWTTSNQSQRRSFNSEGKHLDNDSVFAVENLLIVRFVNRKDNPKAELR
jgi:hypothetical protein